MVYIKVTTQFEGFHRWKNAPTSEAFLRNEHRHIFHVVVKISVEERDRELEYFAVKKDLNKIIDRFLKNYNKTESCEMIAEYILDYLEALYPIRMIEVEVNEDNENGSIFNNNDRLQTL